ncbi:ABC transporter ATP-binding protein [Phaeovibrio sulfidiphilus]|uniref:ABC transporter ATP-binding protein n=1 Tax=Phaeovibrio sulfidiphilus TaxID=1220600 RepID=A0A8J6YNU6_9PROT|nr:ABC transporter ATP-binding protein [Phaeovibrio sulfidiphilus]MBE1238000.1 ABC transporter ATP-binding protein [Phaeovibrio sulfidiphilus]
MTAAIRVRDLSKRFGARLAVDALSLDVPRGRIMGFLGPNGSGKTTTLRMLCGLLTPDGGGGSCLGYDLRTQAARIKRHIGYMTQKFSLYEDLTIQENLEFIARVHGLGGVRMLVSETLARLGLQDRRRQLAGQLSGGWKQRLALAACTLHRPQVLLLDEPTAGVDPAARRDFWDEIHALAAEGMTVLVSTHYMDEAERCHVLAYIAYGKLLAAGSAQEIIDRAGLTLYSVHAADPADGGALGALAAQLRGCPGVDVIAPFGNALHVGGVDARALDGALSPVFDDARFRWAASSASLEDAFIHLMARARAAGTAAGAPS